MATSAAAAAAAATATAAAGRKSFRELHGVVLTAGLMQRTVKVRVGGQRWNGKLKKFFDDPKTYLVHDPNDSLRTGDVVAIEPGWRSSKHKRHVVKHIIAPSGTPIEERPPIPTEDERWAAKLWKKAAKDERRAAGQRGSGEQQPQQQSPATREPELSQN